jgi:hypothetical protein
MSGIEIVLPYTSLISMCQPGNGLHGCWPMYSQSQPGSEMIFAFDANSHSNGFGSGRPGLYHPSRSHFSTSTKPLPGI